MMIRIAPITVEPSCNCISAYGHEEKEHVKRYHVPITYWAIYLDDKYISYTSTKEMAEKTRLWMEKWLGDRT